MREDGRLQGASPSQSYEEVSTTTLFMAVADIVPRGGTQPHDRRWKERRRRWRYGSRRSLPGSKRRPSEGSGRAAHAVAVDLAGAARSGTKDVPVVIGPIDYGVDGDDARRAAVVVAVEKQQVHAESRAGEDAEIDPAGRDGGAKRIHSAAGGGDRRRCAVRVPPGARALWRRSERGTPEQLRFARGYLRKTSKVTFLAAEFGGEERPNQLPSD